MMHVPKSLRPFVMAAAAHGCRALGSPTGHPGAGLGRGPVCVTLASPSELCGFQRVSLPKRGFSVSFLSVSLSVIAVSSTSMPLSDKTKLKDSEW